MSRSTQPFKGFFQDGWHLVAIIEVENVNGILITFADGNNNKFPVCFEMNSTFIKMCGDAGLISEESVFDSKKSIGARLMIEIVEGMLADTKEYNRYSHPLEKISQSPLPLQIKQKIIEEQREMIKRVESNEFDM